MINSHTLKNLNLMLEDGSLSKLAYDAMYQLINSATEDAWQAGYNTCFSRIQDLVKEMS